MAREGKKASCTLEIVGGPTLRFSPTIGGYLEAARGLFLLEEIPGVTIRYRRGRRP